MQVSWGDLPAGDPIRLGEPCAGSTVPALPILNPADDLA